MFSAYASRFLSQSQSRLSVGGTQTPEPQNDAGGRNPSARPHRPDGRGTMNHAHPPHSSRFGPSRSYLHRPSMPSPYNPSGSQQYTARFPLGSRTGPPAPLFYSATDEFREEDDGEEHEREVADFYALQKSRAHFAGSRLSESSDVEDEGAPGSSIERSGGGERGNDAPGFGGGRGIKSSWRGDKMGARGRSRGVERVDEGEERDTSRAASGSSEPSSKGKGTMVNVDLASTLRDSIEDIRRDEIPEGVGDGPPSMQNFRNPPRSDQAKSPHEYAFALPRETDEETARLYPRPTSPDRESVPADATLEMGSPRHDAFWATLFWICFAMLFATSFLIWLHTAVPSRIGDSIYSTLHKSFFQLAVYTVVAVFVSQLWLALLRFHAKKLILTMLVAVPVVLLSFSIYAIVSSYKVTWSERSIQDEAMRYFSVVPLVAAFIWTYTVYRGRHAFGKATEILEFACTLLASHPALLLVGFAHLAAFTIWTWVWLVLFARLFLTGHLDRKNLWIISGSAWALGVFYTLTYLWTLGILSGLQRCVTAATVSQWYFHRRAEGAPPPRAVVRAALAHATGPMYGTVCLSSLLTLAGRLPLLVLPRRLAGLFSLCCYNLVPTPIGTLTNPLALTHAAIYSQPLGAAARALGHLPFVSRLSPSTAASPQDFGSHPAAARPLRQYALAKLLLHATRYAAVAALGLAGWVTSARSLEVVSPEKLGYVGSLYAYVVGLASAAIGWGVLGAMEGVLGGIVDALVVCWGSETGGSGNGATGAEAGMIGQARYCREAAELFGEAWDGRY